MASYTNFYETVKEAEMRLSGTVVMYEDEPYYVLTVTNHKGDGVFRIYLDSIGHKDGMAMHRFSNIPYSHMTDDPNNKERGQQMDNWLALNPNAGVIRKDMNSPKFNKYRPFPLGMVNYEGNAVYVERQPTRHTTQGLTNNAMSQTIVSMSPKTKLGGGYFGCTDRHLYETIKGRFPSFRDSIREMKNPECTNESVAFSRDFALLRGPCNILFLGYKTDVVGYLSEDTKDVFLDRKFKHTKEAVQDLRVFNSVN